MNIYKIFINFFNKKTKNNMDFGGMTMIDGGGPMVSGQWINQKTGETVTVRDSYMDGEGMFVVLTNGQTLSMDEFTDYVQMSTDESDKNKPIAQPVKKDKPSYDPNIVFEGMERKESSSLQKQILGDEYIEEANVIETITTPEVISESLDIIYKILDKTDKPKISFNVEWDSYPTNEMNMLKEYFGITNDDIAKAIINKYVNTDDICDIVTEWVEQINK